MKPPERLVFTWLWEDHPNPGDSGDTLVTVEFFDRGDEHVMTRLVMSFPDPDRLVHDWTSKQGATEHVGHFEFKRAK